MAEPSPAPTEKPVNVTGNPLGRLWTLTIVSLTLNVLILALIVVGAIIHHHHGRPGFGGRDGRDGGCFAGRGQFGGGPRFHHFGGPGWGPPRGFGGGRFGDQRNNGFRGGNSGGPGRDSDSGPGGSPPGMVGMLGMMGGDKNGPPDPAKMTDGILNHLSTTLSLTDDQKAKIKPIVEQQVAEIQKQMEAQRQAMQKRIEDAKAAIKPLLNADQQKQLDAMPVPGQKPPQPNDAAPAAPKAGP